MNTKTNRQSLSILMCSVEYNTHVMIPIKSHVVRGQHRLGPMHDVQIPLWRF